MKLAALDDEARALNMLDIILRRFPEFSPRDELKTFTDPLEALKYIVEEKPDVAFLDVEMPDMSGLELSHRLLERMDDPPEFVFVTAFPQYSMKAWEVEAADYVLKPYDPEKIYRALRRALLLRGTRPAVKKQIYIRCFPDFEALVDGEPLLFRNRKAKELLALLVHYRGGWVDTEKLTFALLEEAKEDAAKNYVRVIFHRLRQTLAEAGAEEMVCSRYGKLRADPDKYGCDYYEYLDGRRELFHGSYMGEYSWAQSAAADLRRSCGMD